MTNFNKIKRITLVLLLFTVIYSCDFNRKDPTSNPDKVAKIFFELVKNGDEIGFKKYLKKGEDYNSDIFSRTQRDFVWNWKNTKYLTCDVRKTEYLSNYVWPGYKGDYIVLTIYFQDILDPTYRAFFVVNLERAEDGMYYVSKFTFMDPEIENNFMFQYRPY